MRASASKPALVPVVVLLLVALLGTAGSATLARRRDFNPQAEDFTCILGWKRVRDFRITNLRGEKALRKARRQARKRGRRRFPVGTVIQLVPVEAMVKRGRGFSPATNDWEFFFLDIDRATGRPTIAARGTTEVVNRFGGNCFACHRKAAPRFDFLCEDTNGCDPLPIDLSGPALDDLARALDPRCAEVP